MITPHTSGFPNSQMLVAVTDKIDTLSYLNTSCLAFHPHNEYQAFEYKVVCHCSPTLSSLKPGSLFRCCYSHPILSSENHIHCTLQACHQKLAPHGVNLEIVSKKPNWSLIYIYRSDLLRVALNHPLAAEYLYSHGYSDLSVESALNSLKQRFKVASEFPHEIGFFLGYPPEDVLSFIASEGKGSLACGHWKAYSNLHDAHHTFELFRTTTKENLKRFAQGCPIELLAAVN